MNETVITIVGNLVADAEVRFTPSGKAVANFTVASTPRTYNKQSGQWEDQEALFQRCQAWNQLAENVAETLTKGMRVVVTGKLRARKFQTQQGETRTAVDLVVDEVGPSLRYATAEVRKVDRSGPTPAASDPWGQPPPAPAGAGGGQAEDAPF